MYTGLFLPCFWGFFLVLLLYTCKGFRHVSNSRHNSCMIFSLSSFKHSNFKNVFVHRQRRKRQKLDNANISLYNCRDPVNSQGCVQFYSTVYLTDTPGKFRLDFQDHGMYMCILWNVIPKSYSSDWKRTSVSI